MARLNPFLLLLLKRKSSWTTILSLSFSQTLMTLILLLIRLMRVWEKESSCWPKNFEVYLSLLMDCSVLDLVGHWWMAWERRLVCSGLVEMSLALEKLTLSSLMMVLEIMTMAY